ncbi:cupin-like domain-containing protein [Massilia pseudoviolaceinigra]|uniref:cupin-like domain-containing protein n=1 Tax=Massilia pseudoviolaceinigra TaxID=3057165 RepID=UPI002796444B|nr:cupin-like domain-containing protein [Massilia sp. CCM 9206]MDQ1924665.1 cupin-like domain-containing protein [Massilia sp. CCM 9206]
MSFLSKAWNALGDVGLWAFEEVSIYRRKRKPAPRIGKAEALARLRAADYGVVERVKDMSSADFLERYLMQQRPVIVTDGLRDWPARQLWSFDYFRREFGGMTVQLQDAGFRPGAQARLDSYLAEIAARSPVELGQLNKDLDYLRYTYDSYFKHLLFTWGFGHHVKTQSFSFVAFQRIREHWGRPYFLPAGGYRIPWVQLGSLRPNERMCQDWGLYFSAPGACTRLHADGMRSNAVLCQIAGKKAGWIFSPSLEGAARSAAEGSDAEDFAGSGADSADRIWRFDLAPGEILLIPRGLAHEVHTLSPSISLTFNFVTNLEFQDYFRYKAERGSGWIASAPISAVSEFAEIYRADPNSVVADANREVHLA